LNLNPQSLFVGQSVIFVQEIDSTNEYLKNLAKQRNLTEGTVVVTEFQSKGKGQRGNTWQSEAGVNGLFSCLLQPKGLRPDQLSAISFLVGLAVRAVVQKYAPDKVVTVKCLLPDATSMSLESTDKLDVASVISDCLTFVEKYYLLTKRDGGVKQLWELYVSQLYKHEETVQINGEGFKVIGVKETGELIVSNKKGERLLQHKEVDIQWN